MTPETVIIRQVENIRRQRTPRQFVAACGREPYVVPSVLDSLPEIRGSEVAELHYFCLFRPVSDLELVHEFELRRLMPDWQAQTEDNTANPNFANDHPNGTHWRYQGQWCYLAFAKRNTFRGLRYIDINFRDYNWAPFWWFAGVSRRTSLSATQGLFSGVALRTLGFLA